MTQEDVAMLVWTRSQAMGTALIDAQHGSCRTHEAVVLASRPDASRFGVAESQW
jgi:hypothetical protein